MMTIKKKVLSALFLAIIAFVLLVLALFLFAGTKFCIGEPVDKNHDGVFENCFISQ